MPSFKGIECSLMLGPERHRAREIEEQTTQNTVTTVIEVEGKEFAFKLRLEGTRNWTDKNWFTVAIYLDGVFVIDRINAVQITRESPEYEFPIIDAAECKDKHGKWFKQRFIFEPVKTNNIIDQDSNEEFHGMIELKVWRCTKITAQSKLPDKPHKTRVNHISQSCVTHNKITYVACLGPKERFPAQRTLNTPERNIIDRTYRIHYLDNEDKPYATFKFQYRSYREALVGVDDQVWNSPSNSTQGVGAEEQYHSTPDHIAESIQGVVDGDAGDSLSQAPAVPTSKLLSNEPTLASVGVGSNSIYTTNGGLAITKCVQGHIVYCSQCTTAHSVVDSDGAGERAGER